MKGVGTWVQGEHERTSAANKISVKTKDYFRAKCLNHNALTLTIPLHADYMIEKPNYRANEFREAHYRKYILDSYRYLNKET